MNDLRPIVPRLLDGRRVICGFTTRTGGVSRPPFDSLNLGVNTDDDPVAVRENCRILFRYFGVHEDDVALMRQVHGADVRIVDHGGVSDSTDGIFTTRNGLLLGVRVADCVPVLFHDTARGVIGAVHCGWRPIAADILERSLALMHREWGSHPGDVQVVLGPSAGACCYEVGGEITERFAPESLSRRDGRVYADLHAEIAGRLIRAGVSGGNLESISRCTICHGAEFFSHRRDGRSSGRMMGYIMLTGGTSNHGVNH